MNSTGIRSTLARKPGWYLISALVGAIVLVVAYHLYGKVPEDALPVSIGPLFNLVFKLMRITVIAVGFTFGALPVAFGIVGGLYHLLRYPDKESVRFVLSKVDRMFYPPLALIATAWTFRWVLFRVTGMGPEGAVGVSPMLTVLSIIANLLGTAITIGWLGAIAVGAYKMLTPGSVTKDLQRLTGEADIEAREVDVETGEECPAEGEPSRE